MPLLLNLLLVTLLIGCAGVGGYLLARAHFTATIANRVLAYQSRLARAQRDGKQAHKDVDRLNEEIAVLNEDLTRARDRVHRYEVALFEGDPANELELQPVATAGQDLQQQANAYVQRVGGYDDFDRAGDQEAAETQVNGAEQMSRAIA